MMKRLFMLYEQQYHEHKETLLQEDIDLTQLYKLHLEVGVLDDIGRNPEEFDKIAQSLLYIIPYFQKRFIREDPYSAYTRVYNTHPQLILLVPVFLRKLQQTNPELQLSGDTKNMCRQFRQQFGIQEDYNLLGYEGRKTLLGMLGYELQEDNNDNGRHADDTKKNDHDHENKPETGNKTPGKILLPPPGKKDKITLPKPSDKAREGKEQTNITRTEQAKIAKDGTVYLPGPDGTWQPFVYEQKDFNVQQGIDSPEKLPKNLQRLELFLKFYEGRKEEALQVANSRNGLNSKWFANEGKVMQDKIAEIDTLIQNGVAQTNKEPGFTLDFEALFAKIYEVEEIEDVYGTDDINRIKNACYIIGSYKDSELEVIKASRRAMSDAIADSFGFWGGGNSEYAKRMLVEERIMAKPEFAIIEKAFTPNLTIAIQAGNKESIKQQLKAGGMADAYLEDIATELIEQYNNINAENNKHREQFKQQILDAGKDETTKTGILQQRNTNFPNNKASNRDEYVVKATEEMIKSSSEMSIVMLARMMMVEGKLKELVMADKSLDADLLVLQDITGIDKYQLSFNVSDDKTTRIAEAGQTIALSAVTMGVGGLAIKASQGLLKIAAAAPRIANALNKLEVAAEAGSKMAKAGKIGLTIGKYGVEGVAFYQGSNLATNFITKDFDHLFENAGSRKENLKSVAFIGVMHNLSKIIGKIPGFNKIGEPHASVPINIVKNVSNIALQGGLMTLTSQLVELGFEGEMHRTREEFIQACILIKVMHTADRAGKKIGNGLPESAPRKARVRRTTEGEIVIEFLDASQLKAAGLNETQITGAKKYYERNRQEEFNQDAVTAAGTEAVDKAAANQQAKYNRGGIYTPIEWAAKKAGLDKLKESQQEVIKKKAEQQERTRQFLKVYNTQSAVSSAMGQTLASNRTAYSEGKNAIAEKLGTDKDLDANTSLSDIEKALIATMQEKFDLDATQAAELIDFIHREIHLPRESKPEARRSESPADLYNLTKEEVARVKEKLNELTIKHYDKNSRRTNEEIIDSKNSGDLILENLQQVKDGDILYKFGISGVVRMRITKTSEKTIDGYFFEKLEGDGTRKKIEDTQNDLALKINKESANKTFYKLREGVTIEDILFTKKQRKLSQEEINKLLDEGWCSTQEGGMTGGGMAKETAEFIQSSGKEAVEEKMKSTITNRNNKTITLDNSGDLLYELELIDKMRVTALGPVKIDSALDTQISELRTKCNEIIKLSNIESFKKFYDDAFDLMKKDPSQVSKILIYYNTAKKSFDGLTPTERKKVPPGETKNIETLRRDSSVEMLKFARNGNKYVFNVSAIRHTETIKKNINEALAKLFGPGTSIETLPGFKENKLTDSIQADGDLFFERNRQEMANASLGIAKIKEFYDQNPKHADASILGGLKQLNYEFSEFYKERNTMRTSDAKIEERTIYDNDLGNGLSYTQKFDEFKKLLVDYVALNRRNEMRVKYTLALQYHGTDINEAKNQRNLRFGENGDFNALAKTGFMGEETPGPWNYSSIKNGLSAENAKLKLELEEFFEPVPTYANQIISDLRKFNNETSQIRSLEQFVDEMLPIHLKIKKLSEQDIASMDDKLDGELAASIRTFNKVYQATIARLAPVEQHGYYSTHLALMVESKIKQAKSSGQLGGKPLSEADKATLDRILIDAKAIRGSFLLLNPKGGDVFLKEMLDVLKRTKAESSGAQQQQTEVGALGTLQGILTGLRRPLSFLFGNGSQDPNVKSTISDLKKNANEGGKIMQHMAPGVVSDIISTVHSLGKSILLQDPGPFFANLITLAASDVASYTMFIHLTNSFGGRLAFSALRYLIWRPLVSGIVDSNGGVGYNIYKTADRIFHPIHKIQELFSTITNGLDGYDYSEENKWIQESLSPEDYGLRTQHLTSFGTDAEKVKDIILGFKKDKQKLQAYINNLKNNPQTLNPSPELIPQLPANLRSNLSDAEYGLPSIIAYHASTGTLDAEALYPGITAKLQNLSDAQALQLQQSHPELGLDAESIVFLQTMEQRPDYLHTIAGALGYTANSPSSTGGVETIPNQAIAAQNIDNVLLLLGLEAGSRDDSYRQQVLAAIQPILSELGLNPNTPRTIEQQQQVATQLQIGQ